MQTLLRRSAVLAAVAILTAWSAPAAAQTPALAEVAKKEQDRRKTTTAPKKVYTSKDLPKPATPPAAAPAPAVGAPDGAAPAAASPAPADPADPNAAAADQSGAEAKDEQWWRQQMAALRDEMTRNEMFLEALQTRINSLATDYVSRDDPAQRARVAEDRQRSLAMIDRVKMEIEKATKAIAELEEEARKAGVPPGWLR